MLAEETVIVASDLLEELRERFAAAYGDRLHAAVLFGSDAVGSAGPDSDIDLLAVLEPLTGDYGDALERGLAAVCPVLCEVRGSGVAARRIADSL